MFEQCPLDMCNTMVNRKYQRAPWRNPITRIKKSSIEFCLSRKANSVSGFCVISVLPFEFQLHAYA